MNENYTMMSDVAPDQLQKIICVGTLPSGGHYTLTGHVDGKWFVHSTGAVQTIGTIIKWRAATDWEISQYWDAKNWIG